MKHILSVWLPNLALDRLKQHRNPPVPIPAAHAAQTQSSNGQNPPKDDIWERQPLALIAAGAKGLHLTAVNAAARNHGLAPAMALTDARAQLPALKTLPAQPEADARTLSELARWCSQYTPWVNTDGADGLSLDITGCGHLFGGDRALARDLQNRLKSLGYHGRLGLGRTPGAAWALARYADQPLCPLEKGAPALEGLEHLPVEALRLAPATVTLLNRLGLKTIGSLCAVPRTALARRFRTASKSRAAENAVLHRLDQVLGLSQEPISPIAPPAYYRTRLNLPEPVLTREAIEHILQQLIAALLPLLEKDQLGARALSLGLYRTDGTLKRLEIAFSRPARDQHHFFNLFKEHIDKIDPGFGIDTLVLNADRTEPLSPSQSAISIQSPQPRSVSGKTCNQLIDRLTNKLGSGNVYGLAPRQSHIPERAQRKLPTLQASRGERFWENAAHLPDRPIRLLPRPEPIAVIAEVPDGPPLSFSWRKITRRIAFAAGPERITPEWWQINSLNGQAGRDRSGRPPPALERLRDYYKIEDEDGHLYWVFRAGLYEEQRQHLRHKGAPLWYLHGFFS